MGSLMQRRSLIAGVAAIMVLAGRVEAVAVELIPHRAIYSVKLGTARTGSGVTAIRGAMVFELSKTCENWTLQQKARFEMTDTDGDAVQSEVSFTSWESIDGRAYGFSLRTSRDGDLVEEFRGRAELSANEEGGEAVYSRPELRSVELPGGTMFPVTHTAALIEAALAGKDRLTVPLFLGEREDEPMMVHAVFAGQVPANGGDGPLKAGPAWRVHMAFFGPDDDSLPAFEMVQTLHASGLVTDVSVQYEDFSMVYSLEKIEPLSRPGCQ